MLCAPVSTGPSSAHFPDILGWFSEALLSRMGTGYVINHVSVVTSDALLDWPGLASQGAGVCPAVGGVNATKAPCLATFFESRLESSTNPLSPVHWGQFGSHQEVSQVGRSQVCHHWCSHHPVFDSRVPLHQKIVVLVQNTGRIRQSPVKGDGQDDRPLVLRPHHLFHHLLS